MLEDCCYLCGGEAAPRDHLWRYCDCDTYCHAQCFKTMVRTVPTHHTHCGVCKRAYDLERRRSRRCYVALPVVVADVALLIAFAVFVAVSFCTFSGERWLVLQCTATLVLSATCCVVWSVHRAHALQRGTWCTAWCEATTTLVARPVGVKTTNIVLAREGAATGDEVAAEAARVGPQPPSHPDALQYV